MWGLLALLYVGALWGISYVVGRRSANASLDAFYVARRQAHWVWVGYSMVGTALSGITFISLPGSVKADSWTYLQVVTGYLIGYLIVAYALLPAYYRYARASIYEYFRHKLGTPAEKTAAIFFLLSRALGGSLRLFLALWAMKQFLPQMPFSVLVLASLVVILLYTLRSGVSAIIYTDFLQTTIFLAAIGLTIYLLWQKPILSFFETPHIIELSLNHPHFWLKDIMAGALIALSMTGLDQDQMQKSLSLPTLPDAQKNFILYGLLLFPVNLLFLYAGSTLWAYLGWQGENTLPYDQAFIRVVQREGGLIQVLFVLGVTAAALSSADGTLTALTTATLRNLLPPAYETTRIKNIILLSWAGIFAGLILLYPYLSLQGHILGVFLRYSGYTYGPLLGLFLFSQLFSVKPTASKLIPWLLPALGVIAVILEKVLHIDIGYATIAWIAGICFIGLAATIGVRRGKPRGSAATSEVSPPPASDYLREG
ncbi:MAG: hypothetical protein NZ580_05510 [Bacteroidia bacterium]|nr:hypothetical protein [Bacteroidia bacterium]MDW8236333.1 hypothetical protein [Bacteroidia bacterium]